jgi:Uma2 family endonuclease
MISIRIRPDEIPFDDLLPARRGDITFDKFVKIVPDGQKADLLDGVIYMASPDNTDAAEVNSWLGSLIYSFVEKNDLGSLYFSRVAYRLGQKWGPEPDIGFLPKEWESTRRRGYINGPPAVAIEIVSPDSVGRDYIQKRAIYERSGVPEYWIIDPDKKQATFLVLSGGRYETLKPINHIFFSKALPGFRLDERWLWKTPRPRIHDILLWMEGRETIPIPPTKAPKRRRPSKN